MAHFTCVNATVDELRATLDQMRDAGIDNVLALRGDPPQGQERWTKTDGGLEYSHELVSSSATSTSSRSAAPPSPRRTSTRPRAEDDLRYLKAKVDAGAQFLITQMFFDNRFYFDFVERARAIGIDVPIIPGHHADHQPRRSIERMTELCGRRISGRPASANSRRAGATTRRSPSSASPTRRCSAPSCSRPARRASTSTR